MVCLDVDDFVFCNRFGCGISVFFVSLLLGIIKSILKQQGVTEFDLDRVGYPNKENPLFVKTQILGIA